MISDELRIITVFLCSFFGAIFVLPKLAHIARRIGLLDQPNSRKIHTRPRPLVGGIGMVIAATFSSMVFIPITGLRGFFLGLSVLLLIGFLDDYKEIGHRQKFAAQILAAVLLVVFSDVYLNNFGNLIATGNLIVPGGLAVACLVTVFCVVGVINAVNLMDGLDGLAGGISFNAFIFFALHASFAGNMPMMLLNFALAGAVLGFLKFNWHPSVLFMGDAGSLCLGFALAFMAIGLTQGVSAEMPPVAALLVLAVPITDTLVIMCKRAIKGTSPFMPDKYHLHHIFMRYGMGRLGAVKAILALSFIMGALSLLAPAYGVADYWLFGLFCVYFFVYTMLSLYIPNLLRYSRRFRNKKPRHGDAHELLKLLFGSFDKLGIIRKTKRYNVYLKMECLVPETNSIFQGKVLDISASGCMAFAKGMDELYKNLVLSVYLPLGDEVRVVEFVAEHIWVSEKNGLFFHGFRFERFTEGQDLILSEYLASLGKKTREEVVYSPS